MNSVIGTVRQSTEERCPYCGSTDVRPSVGEDMMECVCGEEFHLLTSRDDGEATIVEDAESTVRLNV